MGCSFYNCYSFCILEWDSCEADLPIYNYDNDLLYKKHGQDVLFVIISKYYEDVTMLHM